MSAESNYQDWPLDGGGSVICPDCEILSPEFALLHNLLDWIDEHLVRCNGKESS